MSRCSESLKLVRVILRQLTETIASGNGSRPNDTVEKITGNPARTFQDFAHANAAAWSESPK